MIRQVQEIFVSKVSGANTTTTAVSLRSASSNTIDPARVSEGDVYIVDENFNVLLGSTPVNGGGIYIVQGLGAGLIKRSELIDLQTINSLKSEPYLPSVQLRKSLGYSTFSTGETLKMDFSDRIEIGITIIPSFRIAENRLLEVIHTEISDVPLIGATIAQKRTFLDKFVDKFNNDISINKYVVCARTDDGTTNVGLQFTSLDQSIYYSLGNPTTQIVFDSYYRSFNNLTESYAKETVVPIGGLKARRSMGSYEELSWAEYKIQGNRGITNAITFPIPDKLIYSKKGTNYDLYSIQSSIETYGSHQKLKGMPVLNTIAVCTGSLLSTYIAGVLTAINGADALTNDNDLITA